MSMRDNNWLMYTLHSSMKNTEEYFIAYLRQDSAFGLGVKYPKLKVVNVMRYTVDQY